MTKSEEKAKFYKALGEPIRIEILKYILNNKECNCTCELTKVIKRDQSVIFRHLQILKDAGILKTEKYGAYLKCYPIEKEKIRKLLE